MKKITIKSIEEKIKTLNPEEALSRIEEFEKLTGKEYKKLREKYEKKRIRHVNELERLKKLCYYEEKGYEHGFRYIAGIDEVGRGPLAGPVVVAAVILPKGVLIHSVDDSKKLSKRVREELYDEIMSKATAVSIALKNEKVIDEINILNATKEAAKDAVSGLKQKPDLLFIDAFDLKGIGIKQKSIIKGDTKSISIASASILAKVTRDRMMEEMSKKYPEYGFERNMGYGTAEHIQAIKKFGPVEVHRKSFIKNFV
jgi:ribonuclease HII